MRRQKGSKGFIVVLILIIIILLIVSAGLLWIVIKNWNVIDLGIMKEISVSNENTSLTIGTPDDARESIEISTKYVTLLYPLEWEKNLRTEIIDSDVYKVEFYGVVEGKTEQHLFDLVFNGTDGDNFGTLKTESGEEVTINIESYDFEFDDTWTEDEKNMLYTMQEEFNYMIGMLAENVAFTALVQYQ